VKLTGTNSTILQNIRQPTKLEEQNSLIFVYPFIIDKYLERKWGGVLRDFFTTQFMAQIKISNVLNITSQATKTAVPNTNIDKLENSAERAAQSDALGLLTNRTSTTTPDYQNYYNQLAKHEYQEKINEFRSFVKSQVSIDPRFQDTRAMISSITVENLIDIPLILGTKTSSLSSIPLFWILFFATGQYRDDFDKDTLLNTSPLRPGEAETLSMPKSIRMDRSQSFEYIGRYIKSSTGIKSKNYEQFLYNITDIPAKTGPSNRISSLMHNIDTDIDKALKIFMRATNERMYSEEVGFSQNARISISNAYLDTMAEQHGTKLKAQNLFTSFVANYIIPTTQSVCNTVIGIDEVNINAKLSKLSNDLVSKFSDLYISLDSEIKNTLLKQVDEASGEAALSQLGGMEQMCEANAKISVVQILAQFKNLSFKLTSRREDIVNFIEQLSRISAQLDTYKEGLTTNLASLSGGVHKQETKQRLDSFIGTSDRDIYYQFFKEILPSPQGPPQQGQTHVSTSNRLSQFLGLQTNTETYIQQVSSCLGSITTFMAYYTFFSYLCEYMGEIKAKVEIQKKDALDFPNYCLVFRKEVVESLYGALAAANYSTQVEIEKYEKKEARTPGVIGKLASTIKSSYDQKLGRQTRNPSKPVNQFTNFKVNETDIMQMIRVLNNRLNIPNLIVVDDKSDTIYYKWMYSGGSIGKLTLSTVQNYISHQHDILTTGA
jgi:hypothetical protein